jgi:NTE family protein
MFSSATEAWDREQLAHIVSARTVSIPTHDVQTTDFNLTKDRADALYEWGNDAAKTFFLSGDVQTYLNSFGKTVEASAPAPALSH